MRFVNENQLFFLHCRFCAELPGLSKQGCKLLFGKLIDPDPSHFSFEDCNKYIFMECDLVGLRNGTCDGYLFIADMSNVSLGHVGRLSPMGLKKLVMYIQEAIPVRLKGLHFINCPSVMDIIMNMARPFMKNELWNIVRNSPISIVKFWIKFNFNIFNTLILHKRD